LRGTTAEWEIHAGDFDLCHLRCLVDHCQVHRVDRSVMAVADEHGQLQDRPHQEGSML
jgi:hypothetical protein